jgi:hypothetical protein
VASSSTFAAGFNEPAFRDAVRQTMLMGMPQDPADQLTWHWKRKKTYAPQDRIRKPYDWKQSPVTDQPGTTRLSDPGDDVEQSLVVPYALEFQPRITRNETSLGQFDNSHATITVLDDDYQQIKDASYATIAGATYEINFVGPPVGLFAVTVYQLYLQAVDES